MTTVPSAYLSGPGVENVINGSFCAAMAKKAAYAANAQTIDFFMASILSLYFAVVFNHAWRRLSARPAIPRSISNALVGSGTTLETVKGMVVCEPVASVFQMLDSTSLLA